MKGLGAAIKQLLAGIARGAMMAAQGSKWVLKNAVGKPLRYVFGRGGEAIPQPQEMELVEEKTAEPITAPGMAWENDPEADSPEIVARALGPQVPGQTYGPGAMEPFDVLNYAKADSIEKREKIAKGMRKNTGNWLMNMDGKQLDALGASNVNEIKRHLENKGHIPGVPRMPFGKNYKGKNLAIQAPPKPEAPAVDQSQFDVGLGMEMAGRELQAKGMFGLMDGFENAAMDRRRKMEGEEREELDNDRAPRPKRTAGMRR